MMTILIIAAIGLLILIGKIANKTINNDSSDSPGVKKNNAMDNLLKRANDKIIVKDYRGAVAIADKILLIKPDNYNALTCRAIGLEALNFNLEAIEDYEKALQIDNSEANIYGLLGLTYRKIGEIDNGQKNLKMSIQKGMKLYEMNYNILLSASDGLKLAMIKKGKISDNLLRRDPSDFVDNLTSVDQNEFKEMIKAQIHNLESTISLDPNNRKLKELYEFAKKQIE